MWNIPADTAAQRENPATPKANRGILFERTLHTRLKTTFALVASLTKQFTMLLSASCACGASDDRAHLSLRSLNSKGKSLQLAQYYTASGTNTRAGIHMVENHVSFSA